MSSVGISSVFHLIWSSECPSHSIRYSKTGICCWDYTCLKARFVVTIRTWCDTVCSTWRYPCSSTQKESGGSCIRTSFLYFCIKVEDIKDSHAGRELQPTGHWIYLFITLSGPIHLVISLGVPGILIFTFPELNITSSPM